VSALVRPLREVTAASATGGPAAVAASAAATEARVSPELTTALFEACAGGRRLRLGYRLSRSGGTVEREMEVDPWAVVLRRSRWYLLCWSHTRNAQRVLRVDRIVSASPLAGTFAPPSGLDPLRVLDEHLSQGWSNPVDVLIEAPVAAVTAWLPRSLGRLSASGESRTRLVASTDEPEWYAGQLAMLPFRFRVLESAPLRDAVAELGRRLLTASASD
jgi:predicted DNA-binding transcriptional regulator YafY